MKEDLALPVELDGWVVRHVAGEFQPRAHRHAEVEVNLVVTGTASYLVGDRRYELSPATVAWLFPGQEHLLVEESTDHVLWWAVFRPELVARSATAPRARPLLASNPAGDFSRRVPLQEARRLAALFGDVQRAAQNAELFNAGLSYLLLLAWQSFDQSHDAVAGSTVHPAVDRVARLLSSDAGAGDLTRLARMCGLSPSHLSRLFKAQMGVSITRFRNQQRLERFLALRADGRRPTTLASALEAGFGSYAQFYRVFREEIGHKPSAGCTAPAVDR